MPLARLPFGRTQVGTAELRSQVDISAARDALREAGVPNAAARIDAVLDTVPDLLAWLATHGRTYPWRYTTDPWRVYATEILLQRTRGDAVLDVYSPFFAAFPTPAALLEADDGVIRDLVRSLGFVNQRLRTLREAAELCVVEYDGAVPADLEALQRPWRVGPYTARACLLFAFHQPLALVDANTARITGRVFDYPLPSQPHKSTAVYQILDTLVPDDPGLARAFNFALIDLGASRCTDSTPDCDQCPLQSGCFSGSRGGTDDD
ncbi:A/G-specific adenine glycosylase [Halarchaeum rubridurum]|uniref:A/G-specific adenine glycosylase n=1 Tax=Halarchaeum rubridurum TaxID=489911 RepID=A0A830G4E5_9EURY|nr:hypothetical protein [Halarchaeum rubridurum]MBP1955709.1 A/G-specific adenine glycosylase [Halarchaeum rubridurum]GGM73995.1 hypothetical protein GCM10009017_24950 [Halarchaeum rubridurum]